jgi:hypothetical protein
MGNPFLFADRFSGAVVHLTTGRLGGLYCIQQRRQKQKMPATVTLAQAFRD